MTAKKTGRATKKPAKKTAKSKQKSAETEAAAGHQRAKDAPRNSEKLYRTLVESALDGIVIHVGDRVAFANRAAAAMLGFGGPAALVGRPLASFVHPDDLASAADRVRRVLAGEAVAYPVEVRYVKRDGAELPVENTGALVTYEGKPAILSVIRDITERKRAEETLKNSLSLVEATLESTDNGILVIGRDGAIVKANGRFAEMWRIPGDILASGDDGRLLNHVLGQLSDPDAFVAKVKALYGDPGAESADLLHFKDGRVFERSSKPMLVGGEPTARVWSFLDVTERKRAEEALRRSEEEYRGLTEHINLGVYRNTVGHEGKFIEANPAIIGMFGYGSKEGFLSMSVSDLYQNPEDRNAFNDKMLKEGFVRGEELWLKKKDGSLFVGSVSAVAVKDEQGHVEYYDGIIDDITERKRTEEALRESEARYRRITEGLTDYQYSVRVEDGRAVETTQSPACASVTGYTAEDYAADPYLWIQMVTPEDRDRVREHARLTLAGEDVPDIEHRIVRKDGEVRWVSDTTIPLKDPSGRLLSYDGVISDITARKRAEEELQKLASVVHYSSELVNLSTLDGKMIFLNEAGSAMLGISPAEVEHFNIMQVIPAHLKEKVETELLPAVMGAGTWAGELQYLNRKTGQLTDVHAMTFVVRDLATGAPLYLANVSLDVTDRKRAEEELRRKAKDLQETNEELTRFTYAVSHDLRSPLVTIQTFQGYLEQDVRSQDAARIEKDLRYIRNATDKMGLLLDELLRLSRVGRVTNPPEEAPLQSLVKEALDLVAGRLAARGVRVEVTEEPVVLTGDRTRLVEVFQNLVDNATKFMGDEPAPRVEIGVEQAGEELVLFVRDNGIGIEPQLQPLVFGLFRKLNPGTEGAGLGLALVRRIVELHGGRVWVESEGLGKGTTFRLTLAQTTRKRD